MGRPTCEVRPATHRNHRLAITDLHQSVAYVHGGSCTLHVDVATRWLCVDAYFRSCWNWKRTLHTLGGDDENLGHSEHSIANPEILYESIYLQNLST